MTEKHVERALDDIELVGEFVDLAERVCDLLDSPKRLRRMARVLEDMEGAFDGFEE